MRALRPAWRSQIPPSWGHWRRVSLYAPLVTRRCCLVAQNRWMNQIVASLSFVRRWTGPWKSAEQVGQDAGWRASLHLREARSRTGCQLASWRVESAASWKAKDWIPLAALAWIRNCFDSNQSVPGCRTSIHLKYCRTGDYGHTLLSRNLYSASRLGGPPWTVMRRGSLRDLCSQERYGRFLQSRRSCWNWPNSVSLTSYIWLSSYEARMDGLWSLADRSLITCLPKDSGLFQNRVFPAFVVLSISGGLESRFPMGSLEFLGQGFPMTFCFRCLWMHLKTRRSKFKCVRVKIRRGKA